MNDKTNNKSSCNCGCGDVPGTNVTLPLSEAARVERESKTTQPSDGAVVQAKEWVEQGSKL